MATADCETRSLCNSAIAVRNAALFRNRNRNQVREDVHAYSSSERHTIVYMHMRHKSMHRAWRSTVRKAHYCYGRANARQTQTQTIALDKHAEAVVQFWLARSCAFRGNLVYVYAVQFKSSSTCSMHCVFIPRCVASFADASCRQTRLAVARDVAAAAWASKAKRFPRCAL